MVFFKSRSYFLFFVFVLFVNNILFGVPLFGVGHLTFGSRDSTIKVSSGSRLNFGSSSVVVDGTIHEASGSMISGNSFVFDNGVWQQEGVDVLFNGTYSPSSSEVFNLTGDGLLRCEPGSLIYGVLVSGLNNVISGQPLFLSPVSLSDVSAELLISIQNALSQDISLNGGTLRLDDDLSLADDVKIVGPGTVDLNDRQFNLGGLYTTAWDEPLVFKNATSISLTGSVKLNGPWYFSGTCNLNGNGAILDITDGGSLVLSPNTKLYLEDIVIKGLGDSTGKIIFSSGTSELYLSNADLGLWDNYTTTIGKIVVDGPSRFTLAGLNWNINTLANLTVDGVTLWLDPLSSGMTPNFGQLRVSRTIYDANGYNAQNVADNIADGTLTLLNDGIIKMVEAADGNIDPIWAFLLGGAVSGDVTLDHSGEVPPGGSINFVGDTNLDGVGSTINFTDPNNPQFIVQPNVVVTLQNVTLTHITQNTILIFPGGQINIGDNVRWEFDEDVVFSNPLINILPGGSLTLGGQTVTRQITLFDAVNPNLTILNIDGGTLFLENIVLTGISHLAYGPNGLIVLNGNSSVDIDVSTGLNFKAVGLNNSLTFLVDALRYSGLVVFGDKSVNELHIRFALISGLAPDRVAARERYPLVFITGGPGIIVGGPDNGTSRLFFDDPYVVLDLQNSNAMQLDTNAHLIFNQLEFRTNNVKQYSARVLIDGTKTFGRKIDPSFIRSLLTRISGQEIFDPIATSKGIAPEVGTDVKCLSRSVSKVNPKKIRQDKLIKERFVAGRDYKIKSTPRIIIPEPAQYDQQYESTELTLLQPLTGVIELRNSKVNNFYVASDQAMSLFMKEGSQIYQGLSDVNLDVSMHKINVFDRNNIINVQKVFTINNNVFMSRDSELIINFVDSGYMADGEPTFVFGPNCTFELDKNCTILFKGSGRVILSNGTVIRLLATEDVKSKQILDRSSFILQDGAVLDFVNGAEASIRGIGNLTLQNGGFIKPTVPCSLLVGDDNLDDIELKVYGNSEICLDLPDATGVAKMSLQKADLSLYFQNGGMLTIGQNGLFELNVSGDQFSTGLIKELSFGHNGYLYIKAGGTFSFAPSRIEFQGNRDYSFAWKGSQSNISGMGLIKYVGYPGDVGFVAKLNTESEALFTDIDQLHFEDLAKYLVNKLPSLNVSIWFDKPDGTSAVRTKNNVNVALLAGDKIYSDDKTTGEIFGRDVTRKSFTITADGKKSK